ncbi:MAG: hypothetical protein ACK5HS_02150 [Mycoplasmatales bacterium]
MSILSILHTSDMHGFIYPTDYVNDRDYGIAKVSSILKNNQINMIIL